MFQRLHPIARLSLPVAVVFVLTLPFAFTDLDLRVASVFYDAHQKVWPLADAPWVNFMYHYGTWATWAAVYASAAVFLAGFAIPIGRASRRFTLYFVLAVIVGPGLLVNTLGKGELDRPRPRSTSAFGGEQLFQRLWHFPGNAHGSSFPSGHASMGFAWLAPAIYLRARRPRVSRWLVGTALVHGAALGLARMAVGAHFLSDVCWSAGADILAAVLLCLVFGTIARARGHLHEYRLDVLGLPPAATDS